MRPLECMGFIIKCYEGRKLNEEDLYVTASKFSMCLNSEDLAPYAMLSYMQLDDLKEFNKFANSHGETPDFKKCVEEIVKKEKLPTWESRVSALANAKFTHDWLFRAALVLLAKDLYTYNEMLNSDADRLKFKQLSNSVTDVKQEITPQDVAENVMNDVFGQDTKINEKTESEEPNKGITDANKVDVSDPITATLENALLGNVNTGTGRQVKYKDNKPTSEQKKNKSKDVVSILGGMLDAVELEKKQQAEITKEYGEGFDFNFVDDTINIPVKKKDNKVADELSTYLSTLPDNNKAYRLVKTGANSEDFALVSAPENYVNTGVVIGIRIENPYAQGSYLFMKGSLYKHVQYKNKFGVMLSKNTSYYKGSGCVSNARAKCINEAVGDYTFEDRGVLFTNDRFFFMGLSRIMAYMWGLSRSDDLSFWEVVSVDTSVVKVKDNRILNAPLRKVLDNGLDNYLEPVK